MMNIGMSGSGNMGSAMGKLWARQGHQVMFSYSRDPKKLEAIAKSAGANARTGTTAEAARFGEVIMLTVQYAVLEDALNAAGSLDGKVVITCVSGLQPDFQGQTLELPTELTSSVAEQIAQLAPGAKVVEAFNLTFAELLQTAVSQLGAERPSLLYCGDDANAKAIAAALIEECGYDAIDAGGLIKARSIEALASIWVQTAVVTGLFPNTGLKILRR
ncbi:transmembrane reductase oxidoreductase [Mastigocladus laminosus UU774]|nr:transmembrane reductase oxidoreductase [Mastigocladus laminosus UU774]